MSIATSGAQRDPDLLESWSSLFPRSFVVLEEPLLFKRVDQLTERFDIPPFQEIKSPSKMDKVGEKTVKVGLEAHVDDFCKVGVINVCKDSKHLFIDGLAGAVEALWEAAVLANPRFSATWGSSRGRPGGPCGRGVDCRCRCWIGLGGEYAFIIDPV